MYAINGLSKKECDEICDLKLENYKLKNKKTKKEITYKEYLFLKELKGLHFKATTISDPEEKEIIENLKMKNILIKFTNSNSFKNAKTANKWNLNYINYCLIENDVENFEYIIVKDENNNNS